MTSKIELHTYRSIPQKDGVMLQCYYGPQVGWSAVKFFNNQKECDQWMKGGVRSTPSKK